MDLMENNEFLLPNERLVEKLHAVAGNKRIITYCGGGIAATVNAMAHQLTGYNNVAVYDGSLFEWLGEKLPAEGDGKWEVWLQPA